LPDPSWPHADLSLRPVCISRGTPRLVQLAFRGVHGFSLTAHLLQASTYGREVVGSARSGHVSSHPLGRVLVVLYGPRAGTKRIVRWLTSRGKSRPPQGPYRTVLGRSNADETLAGGTGSRAAAGSPQGDDTSETGGDGDTALAYGVGEPYTLCRRSAPDGLTHWLLNGCGRRKTRVAGVGCSEGDAAHWPQG
jgi:hypothetical protein